MKTIQCIHLLKFNLIQLSNKLYFLSCFYIGLPFFHVQLWTDCSTPATTKKNLLKFTTVLQTIKGLNKIIPIEPNKNNYLFEHWQEMDWKHIAINTRHGLTPSRNMKVVSILLPAAEVLLGLFCHSDCILLLPHITLCSWHKQHQHGINKQLHGYG